MLTIIEHIRDEAGKLIKELKLAERADLAKLEARVAELEKFLEGTLKAEAAPAAPAIPAVAEPIAVANPAIAAAGSVSVSTGSTAPEITGTTQV